MISGNSLFQIVFFVLFSVALMHYQAYASDDDFSDLDDLFEQTASNSAPAVATDRNEQKPQPQQAVSGTEDGDILSVFERHCDRCHGPTSDGEGGFSKVMDLEFFKALPALCAPR